MSQNYVTIDIETAPNDRCDTYYKGKTYEAPSNYKDEAKIQAYIQEARYKDREKAALSWWTGRVTCIAAKGLGQQAGVVISHPDESELLRTFMQWLTTSFKSPPNLIGKSGDVFDIPFLAGRLMRHKLGLAPSLRNWRPVLSDVNQIFGSGAHAHQQGRLSDYAFGLDLGAKLGTGTDALYWWGEYELGNTDALTKLMAYCDQDRAIVEEMLVRYFQEFVPVLALEQQAEPIAIPFGD